MSLPSDGHRVTAGQCPMLGQRYSSATDVVQLLLVQDVVALMVFRLSKFKWEPTWEQPGLMISALKRGR